jgi:Domain of unknown function (DUF4190)
MTYGGGYSGSPDPFGTEPFGTGPYGSQAPAPAPAPSGEVNTLATLSIVFAFVFAPVGVVLGHVALAQISRRGERGRDRALIGLTLSYVFILFAVVALIVWLILGGGPKSSPTQATPSKASTVTTPSPSVSTTVITGPPPQRPTVTVEDLRVGQCVEVQQFQPDPTRPGSQDVKIYLVRCEVRDGVFQVNLITSSEDQCTVRVLANRADTLFACISDFRG